MEMPSLGDHLLIALIAVAYPLFSTFDWFRRCRRQLERGNSHDRLRFYRRGMIELWLLTLAVLSWWLWSGRTAVAIGIGVPGGWAFWVGMVIVAALSAALGYQVVMVRGSAEVQAQVRKQFQGVPALIMPRDELERRTWIGLSLTAGFCEELLYRGFLTWYLMNWLPGVAAVLVSAAIFGLAHLYLGWGLGVLRASAVGVVFGAAYLMTGSLWVPIVLHAAVDITSGLTGSAALGDSTAIRTSPML